MSLPNLPNTPRIQSAEIIEFKGLNRSDATSDGELSAAENLSTARWPLLSPRGKRTQRTTEVPASATDIFEWDGHILSVAGTDLYYDGTVIGAVTAGQKQWAVVNTQLVVFPDKVVVDISDPQNITVKSMEVDAEIGGVAGSILLTNNSITAPLIPQVGVAASSHYSGDARPSAWIPATYAYGTDPEDVAACCNADGTWDLTKLAEYELLVGIMNYSESYGVSRSIAPGDVVIPTSTYLLESGNVKSGDMPDRTLYNSAGLFGIVTHLDPGVYSISDSDIQWHYNLYKANVVVPRFSELLFAGDAVSITGTPAGISDIEHAIVRSVDAKTNALIFDDNVLRVPTAYKILTAALGTEQQRLRYGGKDYIFTPAELIEAGNAIYIEGDLTSVYVFKDAAVIARYTFTSVSDTPELDPPAATALSAYDASMSEVHITLSVPDLDFICESGNRLWGVSNKENTILVSALGDPRNFWAFDQVDTDSYQLAVGSEGDFTGICAYGGGVCCWKESRLHKILGSYPSEYYSAEYHIEGVASGCDRSLIVINETLYYVGRNGVYAYSGGQPRNIGYAINGTMTEAAAGTDGKRMYLSGKTGGTTAELLVYDLVHGMWTREDDTLAVAFANVSGVLHFLVGAGQSSGTVWKTEQAAPDATVAWSATFVQFTETAVIRKYYLRLDLRLDMTAGSSITVEVQEDGGAWRTVLSNDAQADVSKRVAIPPRRCDRFAVRVSGKGYVVLRAMTREFLTGSERT